MGRGGADYCPLVEARPGKSDVGAPRRLAVVENGGVPVFFFHPHPSYNLSLSRYPTLGKWYHVDYDEVQGPGDLSLSIEDDCVVEALTWCYRPGKRTSEAPQSRAWWQRYNE